MKHAFTLAGGFSVARNEMECAKVTGKRNERNFFKKFLKWSYPVVTARKIQESGFCGAWQGASPNAVSEQSVDDCEPAIIQESGFSVAQSEARSSSVYQEQKLIS